MRVTDICIEDIENNTSSENILVSRIEDCHDYFCEDDDAGDDDCDSISLLSLNDPHLKHISNVVDGKRSYVMTCLDCRVEKAAEDVKQEIQNYMDTDGAELTDDNSESLEWKRKMSLTASNPLEQGLTTRQMKRRRRRAEKIARKKERKKRRKIIEDLIRLEGELNSGMGNYAVAFDTQSEPVSKIGLQEIISFMLRENSCPFPCLKYFKRGCNI